MVSRLESIGAWFADQPLVEAEGTSIQIILVQTIGNVFLVRKVLHPGGRIEATLRAAPVAHAGI